MTWGLFKVRGPSGVFGMAYALCLGLRPRIPHGLRSVLLVRPKGHECYIRTLVGPNLIPTLQRSPCLS